MPLTKESLSMIISVGAFATSLATFVVGQFRETLGTEHAMRQQLTEVLSRMSSTEVDWSDASANSAKAAILSQQLTFLKQQAVYLVDRIPSLVSPAEYSTLATFAIGVGDMPHAEKYYQKAIAASSKSPDGYEKVVSVRNYATFLFTQRKFEEGRSQFKKALSLLSGGDTFVRQTNGYTYQLWAQSEIIFANASNRAEELFESARNEFNGIDVDLLRENALKSLEWAKQFPSVTPGSPDARAPSSPKALGEVKSSHQK